MLRRCVRIGRFGSRITSFNKAIAAAAHPAKRTAKRTKIGQPISWTPATDACHKATVTNDNAQYWLAVRRRLAATTKTAVIPAMPAADTAGDARLIQWLLA